MPEIMTTSTKCHDEPKFLFELSETFSIEYGSMGTYNINAMGITVETWNMDNLVLKPTYHTLYTHSMDSTPYL